jgi:hypothetical protein
MRSGTTEATVQATIDDINLARAAASAVNAPFKLATCGWVLGPQYDRALFDKVFPKEMPVSCINRQVGHEPVDAGFANVEGRGKWAIPWLEDDPALHSPQLWAGRMRRDAVDALKRIARHSLAQRFDNRDGPANGSFKIERNVIALGKRCECDAMLGEQRLVRGYDRLARRERGLDGASRRLTGATDQFNKNIDARLASQCGRVCKPFHLLEVDAPLFDARSRTDCNDVDWSPTACRQGTALAGDLGEQRCADGAQPGDAHFQWWCHESARLWS